MSLSPHAVRILGSLAEKEMTVPDTYPMTSNGLLVAANQVTSRFPIMELGAVDVSAALSELKTEHRLVRLIPSGAGSRVDKYRHIIEERFGLSRAEKAVLCVLLLRGPQTLNEIKTRTNRMYDFADLASVDRVLDRLADPTMAADPNEPTDAREMGMLRTAATPGAVTALPEGYQRNWPSPLIVRLARRPGQQEPRIMHLLAGEVDESTLQTETGSGTSGGSGNSGSSNAPGTSALAERVVALEARVEELAQELSRLRSALGEAI